MPKRMSSVLFFTAVVASFILFAYSGAVAKVCIFKIGGTCVFWSGSVKGVLSASAPDNFQKRPASLGFEIDGRNGLPGTVYCQKPGTKLVEVKSEGVFKGWLRASERITPGDIYTCEGQDGAIVAPVARLDDNQLRKLDEYCGNPDLKAIDFVPFIFEATITLKDIGSGTPIERVKVECTLPDQDKKPLGWNEENSVPEKCQYECSSADRK